MKFDAATWGTVKPRNWQTECFRQVTAYFASGKNAGIVRAIMGSGKSILIAELAATAKTDWKNPVIVTTPTVMLVRQLRATIAARVRGSKTVGSFYTDAKNADADIIVCCIPSVGELAGALRKRNRQAGFWIADEAHKSECATVKDAFASLVPSFSIGFTATPFRSRESENLTLFSEQIFDYGPAQAIHDGVIVRPEIVSWTGAKSANLDDACIEMIEKMKGPGLVNSASIADCEQFAKKLAAALNWKVECVHSKSADPAGTMERLKSGSLQCVCYVDMLCEGVDFPWLQWGCLRRDVGSRVRFHQEMGRFCRAYPGKRVAYILDPNDLFGLHRQSIDACLGCEPTKEEKAEEIEELPLEQRISLIEITLEDDRATALLCFEMEIRRLIVACDVAGMCPDRAIVKRGERAKSITRMQKLVINKTHAAAMQFAPAEWVRFFELMRANLDKFSFGPAADLCCILNSIVETETFPAIAEIKTPAIVAPAPTQAPATTPSTASRWKQLELEFEKK